MKNQTTNMKLYDLLQLLPLDEHVYITGHVHPDGDCLGAVLGLFQVLKNNNYKVTVILEERPEVYEYLSGFHAIMDYSDLKEFKEDIFASNYSFIVMDSGDLSRIEPIRDLFEKAKRTVNIDHHESNNRFADYNYIDTKASSTSEMVGLLIGLKKGEIEYLTKEIAECLYTGIIYDTGVFKHSNTRLETHLIAAYLIETGIDHTWITNHCFFTKSYQTMMAIKIALSNLEMALHEKIAITVILKEDLDRYRLVKSHTEAVVNILNEIEGTLGSAFLLELEPNVFKVSFRSGSDLNVCEVAKKFGGGGHIKAAGCTINGKHHEVMDKVLKELNIEYQRHY